MMQSELPGTYRRVEYLESSGTQWFDSGVECTGDLSVAFMAQSLNTANAAICGGINTTSAPIYFRHHCSPFSASIYWIQNNDSINAKISYSVDWGIQWDQSMLFDLSINADTGMAIFNGVQILFTPLPATLTTGKGFGIFGRISNSGDIQSKAARIYYFKLLRGGILLRNFIPCVRKSDSKPGMYDTVSNTFYTNAGTGEFVIPT